MQVRINSTHTPAVEEEQKFAMVDLISLLRVLQCNIVCLKEPGALQTESLDRYTSPVCPECVPSVCSRVCLRVYLSDEIARRELYTQGPID